MEQSREPRPHKRATTQPKAAPSPGTADVAGARGREFSLPVAPRHGPGEKHAEEAEAGRAAAGRGSPTSSRSPLAAEEGSAVPGHPDARVHSGTQDQAFARLLGARAATHGRDIFLGEGESVSDEALMRHELAHVAEGDDTVRLRSATYLERRAWLGFFDHYLPRKFLNNYMDDSGMPIWLTLQEMQDCNPVVDVRRSTAFMTKVAALAAPGGGTATFAFNGWGGARTNGTLGNFTVKYYGTVVVKADGSWTFGGTMTFYDYWDFDPKGSGSGRPWQAELKVRVAAAFLPGQPFPIFSVAAPMSQSSADSRAMWGTMAAPVFVPEKGGRAGADIGGGEVAGGATGDVAGGPLVVGPGADIGGEIGAQSAEDLNK
ncbi:protein of unknown function [Actinopolymorpha singaporensis]|uniref:eCIS core domain-containing protein n=1 Tax=Actinopolymorpha singaporensis TaxID=117157 RepID=A0A1H1UZB0_9ACTN|nr:protein of unknown function [Actinopolymorpha singaporensis]